MSYFAGRAPVIVAVNMPDDGAWVLRTFALSNGATRWGPAGFPSEQCGN